MMRLVPRSLGGQLAALLVAGLLTAHIASLVVFSGERSRAVETVARFGVGERIAALVEVIDDASPDLARRLADALSTRGTRISIDMESALPEGGMSDFERSFAEHLAEELNLSGQLPRVRFIETERQRRAEPERRRRLFRVDARISIPLSDGTWLNASSALRTPRVNWSWPWLVSLAASAAVTLVIVALVVRRITRPMRALAAAAERIGRGEAVRLHPQGPAEIRTTVEAFNAMEERLSRFVQDRTRMVAAISHDLRTPITSLRLRAEFIEDEELKQAMARTLDEMQAMTEATLAFAREEAGGEATRDVDLAALIDGVVEDQRALGKDVSYLGQDRLAWRCRPASLKRAVTNLVENAERYGGSAKVGLSLDGGEAVITVDDPGPGIPDNRLDDVFEPFVRLESSRNRDTGGVGLGLAIARSIVRAHGGELTLANRQEGGLRATLTLP